MHLYTTIPIYRNRFQKPTLFFSANDFPVGFLVLVPYRKKEKFALIIQKENLKEKKFFLRKNKIKVTNIKNSFSSSILKKKIINLVLFGSIKTQVPIEEILQKIIPLKLIKKLNKISVSKDLNSFFKKEKTEIMKEINKISLKKTKNKLQTIIDKDKKIKKHPKLKIGQKKEDCGKIKTIDQILKSEITQNKKLHSEKHYLVDEMRKYFCETATKGKGSFSFYLGFFKKIPKATIYQYWAETKESRKSLKAQQKLFWWKIGQYLKKKD